MKFAFYILFLKTYHIANTTFQIYITFFIKFKKYIELLIYDDIKFQCKYANMFLYNFDIMMYHNFIKYMWIITLELYKYVIF